MELSYVLLAMLASQRHNILCTLLVILIYVSDKCCIFDNLHNLRLFTSYLYPAITLVVPR